MKKGVTSKIVFALIVAAFVVLCFVQSPITSPVNSLWSLLPPVVAIGLALITKEVYSSLFLGIVTGGLLCMFSSAPISIGEEETLGSGFPAFFNAVVNEGIIKNLSDSWNVGILVFLVVLGIIVVLMNRAGGSRAYGEWAVRRIKTRRGASLATFGLGALIFVDDYFNCLTVGSVMRPVTDSQRFPVQSSPIL